jgi:hypothetical protein
VIQLNGHAFADFGRAIELIVNPLGLIPAEAGERLVHHHGQRAFPGGDAVAPGEVVFVADGENAADGMKLGVAELPVAQNDHGQQDCEQRTPGESIYD